MIKKLLLISSCCLLAIIGKSQNSIGNGAFENWATTNYENLQFYNTGNMQALSRNFVANCNKSTDAYHGSFAIQLTTLSNATDTADAFFYNGNPNGDFGSGGMPYSEQPTGLRFYYKCNFMPNDTGNVIIMFKKNGAEIGLHIGKLYGVQTSYQLYTADFTSILTQAPDSVVIGIVTSNVIAEVGGIGGSSLLVDSLSFVGVTNQPAMMNGDFELWQNESYSKLVDWDANDRGTTISNNAYAGNYALELFTFDDGGNSVRAGTATNGNSYPGGTNGGDPFSSQIDTLIFRYIYTPAITNPLDSAQINLNFKSNGSTFAGQTKFLGTAATYTYGEMPINLLQVPDSILIFLSSSKTWNPTQNCIGSNFIIDEICFKSNPLTTGIPKISNNSNFTIYPNPGKDIITINALNLTKTNTIEINNILGEAILNSTFTGKQTQLNISNLAAGTYFITVLSDTEKVVTKFIKD